jgi:hypothetical protein
LREGVESPSIERVPGERGGNRRPERNDIRADSIQAYAVCDVVVHHALERAQILVGKRKKPLLVAVFSVQFDLCAFDGDGQASVPIRMDGLLPTAGNRYDWRSLLL